MAKIKAAFIGCGGRNGVHLQKCMDMGDVEFVGFCDIIEERAYNFAVRTSTAPEGKIFNNYKDLLANVEPEVVFIAVPPDQHGELEISIIEKGIPFLLEKPICLDIKMAEKIEALIKEKGLINSVGFQDRYQDITQMMKEYVKDRKVGLVSGAWYGDIPSAPWWRFIERSGGQLLEQNAHIFDQVRYIFGEPEYVCCAGARGIVDPEEYGVPGYNVHDYSSAIIKFKSGVVANIFTGCYTRLNGGGMQNGINVYCKDAVLEYELRSRLTVRDANGEQVYKRGAEPTAILDKTFLDAVRTGDTSKILSDYSEALKTLKLCYACNESIETGKTIYFD